MSEVDEELEAIQPHTYWEKRCYATEQFIEMFFSILIPNMPKSDRELAKHLIAEYQRQIGLIEPEDNTPAILLRDTIRGKH